MRNMTTIMTRIMVDFSRRFWNLSVPSRFWIPPCMDIISLCYSYSTTTDRFLVAKERNVSEKARSNGAESAQEALQVSILKELLSESIYKV